MVGRPLTNREPGTLHHYRGSSPRTASKTNELPRASLLSARRTMQGQQPLQDSQVVCSVRDSASVKVTLETKQPQMVRTVLPQGNYPDKMESMLKAYLQLVLNATPRHFYLPMVGLFKRVHRFASRLMSECAACSSRNAKFLIFSMTVSRKIFRISEDVPFQLLAALNWVFIFQGIVVLIVENSW